MNDEIDQLKLSLSVLIISSAVLTVSLMPEYCAAFFKASRSYDFFMDNLYIAFSFPHFLKISPLVLIATEICHGSRRFHNCAAYCCEIS